MQSHASSSITKVNIPTTCSPSLILSPYNAATVSLPILLHLPLFQFPCHFLGNYLQYWSLNRAQVSMMPDVSSSWTCFHFPHPLVCSSVAFLSIIFFELKKTLRLPLTLPWSCTLIPSLFQILQSILSFIRVFSLQDTLQLHYMLKSNRSTVNASCCIGSCK